MKQYNNKIFIMKKLYKLTTLLIAIIMSTSLMAADQEVTNNNNSGAGSLRQAIADVGSGEEITFNGNYTITLTTGQLSISKNLIITGTGAGLTIIDGNNSSRVFNISSGYTVTITNMTIRNGAGTGFSGYNGGGISNSGTLSLVNCTVSGNTISTTLPSYGGGIYSDGTLSLENCTVNANSTSSLGGGIYNDGNVTITNSTISNNTANADGGGIYEEGTQMNIYNSTIANNHADNDDGGGNSGGGIYNLTDGTLLIKNTIIANNYRGSGTATSDDYDRASGTLTDNGYNLLNIPMLQQMQPVDLIIVQVFFTTQNIIMLQQPKHSGHKVALLFQVA